MLTRTSTLHAALSVAAALALLAAPITTRAQQGAQPAPLPGQRAKDKDKQPLDPDLRMGLGITTARFKSGAILDQTGTVSARILGNPMRHNIGPSGGLKFNGTTDAFVLSNAESAPPAQRAGLPTTELTVATWLSVHALHDDRTIIGCLGATAAPGGWRLGASGDQFFFELAASQSASSSAAPKPATRIVSTTRIQPDRWYHLVATYDGRSMKLFVNSEQQGESKDQSGPIVYAPNAVYSVASREHTDTRAFWHGTLLEANVYSRAFNQQRITEEYTPGTLLASYQPQMEATQRFVVKPLLQFGTADAMTIVWETARPGQGIVEFGTQLPYTQRLEGTTDILHKVRLTNLKPGTNYYYRVKTIEPDGKEIVSDDLTFQTVTDKNTPFAFAIIGDTQKNKPVIEKLQNFTLTLRPSLQIHTGDVVDKGPDRAEWTDELLAASYPLLSRVCLYPSIGNHEENHSNYYRYFALPDPQCWYTFTFGNTQFFSIDTNKPVDPGSDQYKWLESELAKSTATWKITYHHHPVYSSDENDYGDTYKGPSVLGDLRIRPLADLYEKYKVDINFNGHIHSYERSWPIFQGKIDQARGVRYITTGGGGGGLESAGPHRTWFAQRVYRGHHVCFAMVHDKTLIFQVFDLEGRLIDQMDITK